MSDDRYRVVLAKIGFDGHDRGLRVVARMLRDAGIEVIYLGLRQTAANVVAVAVQEDADAIGLSMHNAGHMTLAPRVVKAVREAGLDIPVIVGGIIPDQDIEPLEKAGVAAILGPGASASQVVAAIKGRSQDGTD
ncbi:MAG: cobalamin-dependent protein [Acidimicrobiia bacterium]|nr:cobalamin-dependent protein [Acidimicrobiia bacterium]NNL28685.1 methylmalonyl-CoA mutase [Acidimicrobiia bacterium]NNL48352.1 methylmalonyl-CoA mutase [Acidimicrobiia bacterium]